MASALAAADSAYSSSEKKADHCYPSPKKMDVVHSSLPLQSLLRLQPSPPPSAVSSLDGEEDGSSYQEFAEGETNRPDLKLQPRYSSDPDSSGKTPPPAPNPPSAVSSTDEEDGSKDEDGGGDGSSGESDDGEAIRRLPSWASFHNWPIFSKAHQARGLSFANSIFLQKEAR